MTQQFLVEADTEPDHSKHSKQAMHMNQLQHEVQNKQVIIISTAHKTFS